MKLLNYLTDAGVRLGVKMPYGVLDSTVVCGLTDLPAFTSTDELLASGQLARFVKAAQAIEQGPEQREQVLSESDLNFAPCVLAPEKIICLGFNYRRHAAETDTAAPDYPVLFSKFNNSLSAHGSKVELPTKVAKMFDYEAELVVVMGSTATDVGQEEALEYVAGYCVGNDLSARDLQWRTSQFLLGKTSDGFAPIGPYLVTADAVPDPDALDIACYVNGERRQSSNTSDMIFKCAFTVSYVSRYMTLKPGDLLFMGTPEGVVWGRPETERRWLKAGDELVTEIQGLGRQRVRLV
jgi:2-keto-4-pentenoate hydratase/2-oxohepta-3-ene-1,7-dioic acid hydratase in catechol pathway